MESISKKDKFWMKVMDYGCRLGCHQMPERSFFFKKYQFPVCARCSGVLLGEIIAMLMILFGKRIKIKTIFFSLFPMGIDWGLQYLEVLKSTNIRRLITGTIGGLGLTYGYFYALKWIFYDIPKRAFLRQPR